MQIVCIMDIRSFGLKTTKAREGLLSLLATTGKPVEANETLRFLSKKGISADQATVYRSLNIFVKKGLVREIHFNDGIVRYELSNKPEHHHAICISCGKVEDIMDCSVEKIEEQITKKKRFDVRSHSLEFFGYCKNCKNKKS